MNAIKFRVCIDNVHYVRTCNRYVVVADSDSVSYKVQLEDSMFSEDECKVFYKKVFILPAGDVREELTDGLFAGDVVMFEYEGRTLTGIVEFNKKYGFVCLAAKDGIKYPLYKIKGMMSVVGTTLIEGCEGEVKGNDVTVMAGPRKGEINEKDVSPSVPNEPNAVTAYVAGAKSHTGGVGAGYLLIDDTLQTVLEQHDASEGFTAEYDANLLGILSAIKRADAMGANKLVVRSCSQPAIYGITKWSQKWIKNNWKKDDGEDIKFQSVWKTLLHCIDEVKDKMTISFEWVSKENEDYWGQKASQLANKAADGAFAV